MKTPLEIKMVWKTCNLYWAWGRSRKAVNKTVRFGSTRLHTNTCMGYWWSGILDSHRLSCKPSGFHIMKYNHRAQKTQPKKTFGDFTKYPQRVLHEPGRAKPPNPISLTCRAKDLITKEKAKIVLYCWSVDEWSNRNGQKNSNWN